MFRSVAEGYGFIYTVMVTDLHDAGNLEGVWQPSGHQSNDNLVTIDFFSLVTPGEYSANEGNFATATQINIKFFFFF